MLMRRQDVTVVPGTCMDKRGFNYAEARGYLGLKRRAFDKHIRPRLPPPTPCGTCLVFERADLDRAWDEYRAARTTLMGRADHST